MGIVDRPVEILLASATACLLRLLLSQEIARIERWNLVHGNDAHPTVLRDVQDYLTQVRLLQCQVEVAWDTAIRSDAAQAPRLRGARGGRRSARRATELLGVPG